MFQLNGTSTGHVHVMIRGVGDYAVVLTATNHYVLSLARHFIGYIILVQPRNTRNRPNMTEKLLNRT